MEIKLALFGNLLARKISHSEGEIRQREYIRQKFDLIWLAAFNLRVSTEQFSYDSCAASSCASRKNGRKRVIHARKISCSGVSTKDLNVESSNNRRYCLQIPSSAPESLWGWIKYCKFLVALDSNYFLAHITCY